MPNSKLPISSSTDTPKKSTNSEENSTSLEITDVNDFPTFVVLAALVLAAVVFGLGRIAIINAERRDAEKKRGDTLQQSINALRDRSEEDRKFFEIVRQLLIAQGQEQRNALLDQLRGFKFSQPTTTTTTESRTTTTTRFSSVTTAPRSPSTTTTTRPSSTTTTTQHSSPPPSSPPPTKPCTTVPVVGVCSPAPNNN